MDEQEQLDFDAGTHTYSILGRPIPSVTQILHGAGIVDSAHYSEATAWRGSVAHACCQLDDEGDLDEETVSDETWPYLLAWRMFREDSGFTPEMVERQIFNRTWWYAGTLDRAGKMKTGERAVVDLKTGAVQKWHALQTAAYAFALDKPRLYRRFVVSLRRDGTYSVREFSIREADNDFSVFTAAHTLAGWLGRSTL